jgi:hypothetical protein
MSVLVNALLEFLGSPTAPGAASVMHPRPEESLTENFLTDEAGEEE